MRTSLKQERKVLDGGEKAKEVEVEVEDGWSKEEEEENNNKEHLFFSC